LFFINKNQQLTNNEIAVLVKAEILNEGHGCLDTILKVLHYDLKKDAINEFGIKY
jgi:hypothetical protein